jgi:hypothetical protein
MYMKDDFIKGVWVILKKYLSDDKIISKTKNLENKKSVEKIEASMIDYWLNSDISISKKEDVISRWIEKFLNSQELFDYKLDIFGDFYNEIDNFLSKNAFRIEEISDYQTYFKVESPTSIQSMTEMYEQQHFEVDSVYEARQKEADNRDILVGQQNQQLLIQFIENSEIYLKILREYFDNPEITISKEKQFVKAVVSMKNDADKLSLGISGLNRYNFDIIIPFGSLYSLKEDWNNAVKKDTKDRWLGFFIMKNDDFTFENIKSILAPTLKKVSSLISDEFIENSDATSNNTRYIVKDGDDFKYKGKLLPLSRDASYYKVFCALYALLPNGGEVKYKELGLEIMSRIKNTKTKTDEQMRDFIQGNLTEKGNGFMRYSKLPATMDNQRPIIEVVRGTGIRFNNKAG